VRVVCTISNENKKLDDIIMYSVANRIPHMNSIIIVVALMFIDFHWEFKIGSMASAKSHNSSHEYLMR